MKASINKWHMYCSHAMSKTSPADISSSYYNELCALNKETPSCSISRRTRFTLHRIHFYCSLSISLTAPCAGRLQHSLISGTSLSQERLHIDKIAVVTNLVRLGLCKWNRIVILLSTWGLPGLYPLGPQQVGLSILMTTISCQNSRHVPGLSSLLPYLDHTRWQISRSRLSDETRKYRTTYNGKLFFSLKSLLMHRYCVTLSNKSSGQDESPRGTHQGGLYTTRIWHFDKIFFWKGSISKLWPRHFP